MPDLQVVEQTWQTRRPGEGQMATVPASPAERSVDPAGSPGLMKLILDTSIVRKNCYPIVSDFNH